LIFTAVFLDVYIAATDVPGFSWEQSNHPVDPTKLGRLVPDAREAFFLLTDKINEGEYSYIMTDWATWVAKVSKQQIIDFFKQLYGVNFMHPKYGYIAIRERKLKKQPDNDFLHIDIEEMSKLMQTIDTLDDKKTYALVAQEF